MHILKNNEGTSFGKEIQLLEMGILIPVNC